MKLGCSQSVLKKCIYLSLVSICLLPFLEVPLVLLRAELSSGGPRG